MGTRDLLKTYSGGILLKLPGRIGEVSIVGAFIRFFALHTT